MISLKCQGIIVQQKTVGFTLRAADGGSHAEAQRFTALHCVERRALSCTRIQFVCITGMQACTTEVVTSILYSAVHVLTSKDIHEICVQCPRRPTSRNVQNVHFVLCYTTAQCKLTA